MAQLVTPRTKVIFINNPNNPTGTIIKRSEFERFLTGLPDNVIVVLDEAYIEFVRDVDTPCGFDYISAPDSRLVVLRTFSKAYGLAGLRIGYGAMHPDLADYLNRVRQPFNTSALSQIGALAALDDDAFLLRTQQTVWEGLSYLQRELERLQLNWLPTHTNFFLIEVPVDAKTVYEAMLRQGVIVRAMNAYGLPRYIRINVGLPAENERFIQTFRQVLATLGDSGSTKAVT
jgi:histidinol-phosphate aminotransferase